MIPEDKTLFSSELTGLGREASWLKRESFRKEKLEKVLFQTISETLLLHMRDPRAKQLSLDRVEVEKDLKTVKLFFMTALGSAPMALIPFKKFMKRALKYFKLRIAKQLTLRRLPHFSAFLTQGIAEIAVL